MDRDPLPELAVIGLDLRALSSLALLGYLSEQVSFIEALSF
jgi:hypothetical protein